MMPQTTKTKDSYYIGLMSGTSMDAVDAVLVDIKKNKFQLLHTHSEPINLALRDELLTLCHAPHIQLDQLMHLDVTLGRLFAHTALMLLKKSAVAPQHIVAIGSHGQNIRHQPNSNDPSTLQIADPNIIAALTGITTVADFRRRDIALGGQGAPLTPAFHQFLFGGTAEETQWVLNIGGIANATLLKPGEAVIGFDIGPGNTLLDHWCFEHCNKRFDEHGAWARSGTVNQALLTALLSDPYFKKEPPKSTGFEYFNLDWLKKYLCQTKLRLSAQDVQATLIELTAIAIANALNLHAAHYIWICGGGAKNSYLIERLQTHCDTTILSTHAVGIPTDAIEACAFAWFAYRTMHHQSSNIPSVTGATKAAVLGGIYFGDSTT